MTDTNPPPKAPQELVADIKTLVTDYAKQETVEPLKVLGKWVGFGVAGAISVSLGAFLLGLGLLRALQTETGSTFTGNLSWLPYLCTLGAVTVVLGLLGWRITKRSL